MRDESRQLAEAVRRMTADRDRLQARLATLERGLEDVTGSIARVEKVARAAEPAPKDESKFASKTEPKPEPDTASATIVPTPAEDVTASIGTASEQPDVAGAAPAPQAQPAVPGAAPRTEFGVDLGGASSFEALRALWTSSRQRHATLLEGLRPVVQMRERAKPAAVELRLVAGPIPNAATAARLCATITANGAICQPTLFDGQRLAIR